MHLPEKVAAGELELPNDAMRALDGLAATGGSAYARGSDGEGATANVRDPGVQVSRCDG